MPPDYLISYIIFAKQKNVKQSEDMSGRINEKSLYRW